MSLKEIFETALALLVSLGGGGAIVFALSGYLGKRWAERALEKQKQDYVRLNIAFTNQLDIATRRLQIELDAQGLLHKLRIESEFDRIKELWKRVVLLRDAIRILPSNDPSSFHFDESGTHNPLNVKASNDFSERFFETNNFWSSETLSIPKHIADYADEMLDIARDELMRVIQFSDPFYKPVMDRIGSEDKARFFDERNRNRRAFEAMTKELERKMRDYIEGGWKNVTVVPKTDKPTT
jgi:hypothetical protein